MRTIEPRILPGCPYCDNDHDPSNRCRALIANPALELTALKDANRKTPANVMTLSSVSSSQSSSLNLWPSFRLPPNLNSSACSERPWYMKEQDDNELAIREQSGGDTLANRLQAGRKLAAVQQLQSEFWQAVRELEEIVGELRGDSCELDSAKDFNDLDLDDVVSGCADDGGEGDDDD